MLGHSSSDKLDLTSLGSEARGRREEQFSSSVGDMVVSLEDFLGDPTVRRQTKLDVARRITSILDDPEQTQRFATDSSGQPAKALGGGQSPDSERFNAIAKTDPTAAANVLDILEGLTQLPEDQRRARGVVARKVIDGDISVTDRGEVDETERLRQQVKTLEAERNQARKDLSDQRDESNPSSLAAQLKAAKATPPAPADSVKKDDVKSVLDKLGKAVKAEKTSAIKGSTIEGHDAVVSAFNEAADKVGADKLS